MTVPGGVCSGYSVHFERHFNMYWSVVVLLLLQALFGTSLSVKMTKRQLSFVGRECEDQVARMNSECGTSLPNVTSGNKYEALKASCTTQACSDAVVSAFVACSPAEGLTEVSLCTYTVHIH